MSAEQVERVDRYVQIGQAEGAQLLTGGHRPGGDLADGFFYQPTVFAGVQDSMRIAREEIFGPVLSVIGYDDPGELAARANDTDYGLAAVIWSRDIGTANRLAHAVRAGTVWISMPPALDAAPPPGAASVLRNRPGDGLGRHRSLHRGQEHLDQPGLTRPTPDHRCRPRCLHRGPPATATQHVSRRDAA